MTTLTILVYFLPALIHAWIRSAHTLVCTYQWGHSKNMNQNVTGFCPHLHSSAFNCSPPAPLHPSQLWEPLGYSKRAPVISHGLFYFSDRFLLPSLLAVSSECRRMIGTEAAHKHLLRCWINTKSPWEICPNSVPTVGTLSEEAVDPQRVQSPYASQSSHSTGGMLHTKV